MRARNLALICVSLLAAMVLVAGFPLNSKTDTSSVSAVNPAGPSRPTGTATAANKPFSSAASQSIASRAPDAMSLNVARRNHTATALPDGRVLIIGGDNERGVVGDVEVLDVSARTVSVTARLLAPRTQHTATLLADGRVLVSGGFDNNGPLDSTEVFDPKTNAFSPGPALKKARAGHSATVLENGKVLIAGGQDDRSAEIFDPSTNQTTLLRAKTSVMHAAHSAARLNDGSVLIAGGMGVNGHYLDSAEIFDANSLSFRETAKPLMIRRTRPDLRVLPDGKVQVIGGDRDGTMEMYDPATGRFSAAVHLVPTSDLFSDQQMLSTQTRAGFVDAIDYNNPKFDRQSTQSVADRVTSLKESVWRSQYASADIASLQKAVIVGGADSDLKAMNSVLVVNGSSATISTDQVVYLPGKPPVITGAGWKPFERVTIVRQEGRLSHERITFQAIANAKGQFVYSSLTEDAHHPFLTYTLTARGETSSQVAQTAYRDMPEPGQENKSAPFLKFEVPITQRDGSMEVNAGILKWNVKDNAPQETCTGCTPAAGATFDLCTSFPGVVNQTCLGIPGNPCGMTGVTLTEGCFDFSGSFPVEACFLSLGSSGCSGTYFKMGLDQKLSLHGKFDVSLLGSLGIDVELFQIPGASIGFDIPDVLKAETGVTVHAKLEITAVTPTNLQPSFDLVEGYEVGFDTRNSPAFYKTEHTAGSATGDVNLTLLGQSEAKFKLGPVLGFSLVALPGSSAETEIGSMSVGILPFLHVTVTPTQATGSCKAGDIDLGAGVDVDADASSTVAGVTLVDESDSATLFEIGIPGFPKHFFFGTDTTPPVFNNVFNVITETDPDACTRQVTFSPGADDDCSGADLSTLVATPASGSAFPKGVTTVQLSVKDQAGNMATSSFTVTVQDNQRPTFTSCPSSITQNTDPNACGAVVTFAPAATDNCGAVTPSCTPASNTTFAKGTTTVTCTVTDSSGNTALTPCSFTVTVSDNQKPTLNLPSNLTKSTDPNQCQAVVTYNATATDNCDTVSPTCTPASGSTFQKGTTTVNCTVSDSSANTQTGSFTVTVNDTQAPAVTCAGSITKPTDPNLCTTSVTFSNGTATDNCPGLGAITCTPASGSTFQKGVTTISCSVTDSSNNTGSCAFTVTVIDTQAPSIACPSSLTIPTEPGVCSAHLTYSAPAVSDNCPGVGAPSCSPPSGSVFPKGATTISCSVTDASNNQSNCAFMVTVVDREPPKISCPATTSIAAVSSCPFPTVRALTFSAPTASDNCPGVTTICNPPAGSIVPVGTTNVTCTSTDTSANTAQCSFAVHVFSFCLQDETNPSNFVFINAATGGYEFYCGGVLIASGTGVRTNRGCIESIDENKGDRRVHILFDTTGQNGRGAGTATLQIGPNNPKCLITDNNMSDNSCSVLPPTRFDGK